MTNPINKNEQQLPSKFEPDIYESIRAALTEARANVITAVNSEKALLNGV